MTGPDAHLDEEDVDVESDEDQESESAEERVRKALAEIASMGPAQAEAAILELLRAVERGELPLSSLMGYTDDDLYEIYEKAYTLQRGGRPKNVVAICDGLLALSPGLPAVMLLCAAALMDLKEYDRALALVDEVLAADPEDTEALLKRTHILYRLGRMPDCVEAVEAYLQLDEDAESEERQTAERLLEHVRELLKD